MAKVTEYVNSLFDSANTVAGVMNDYTTNEAKRSTQNKQIQLKADLQKQMDEIQRSSTSEQWETKINDYFQSVKGSMSDKHSPYYCKNNMQAEMFDSILSEAQVSVAGEVRQLVFKADRNHALVEYQNSLETLAQTETPDNYLRKANEAARNLRDCGYIDEDQLQQQLNNNYDRCYLNTANKMFNDTVDEAIKRGDSDEKVIDMVFKNMPELMATDTAGLPKMRDTKQLKDTLKQSMRQDYKARLSDIQQGNANTLSQIVQEMRQQNTAEGKVTVARRGQNTMNRMQGLQLSENDRLQYSSIFEIGLNGNVKGSGSGSGTGSSKPDETFANFCKAQPGEAIQMVMDNPDLCPYDAAQIVSNTMVKEWFTGNYKENYDKDYEGRLEDYKNMYEHSTSAQTVTDAMIDKLVEKYPTAANYLKNNCSKLITDMQKNPKEYGEASAGELADFMRDWVLSAPAKATDDDFVNDLKTHVNNCYIERCKQIELKDNGKLRDTFNAKKPADIAKAAQLASEKDFVFTDAQGNERWAKGKKEALEAPGGVVNVLQNAVVGTLGIPESDYKDLGFYYQRDESGHDMTNKPIITYKDKAYEVIANEDGKGFKVRDINSGVEMEGKAGGKLQQVMRKEQKTEAAQEVKTASAGVANVKKEREQAVNKAITESTSIPKAMKAVGTIEKEEWENVKTVENRTTYLNIAERKIDSDASKVANGKMHADDFYKKYGIKYYKWSEAEGRHDKYQLILDSN